MYFELSEPLRFAPTIEKAIPFSADIFIHWRLSSTDEEALGVVSISFNTIKKRSPYYLFACLRNLLAPWFDIYFSKVFKRRQKLYMSIRLPTRLLFSKTFRFLTENKVKQILKYKVNMRITYDN